MAGVGRKDDASTLVLRSGREAWEALAKGAGLTTSEQGRYGYDDELVEDMRRLLVAGASGDLGHLLDRAGVSIDRVLEAFLHSVEPFAQMMGDVLAMFARAAARRSDTNLKLAVDSDKLGSIAFDLEPFREQVERLQRTIAMRRRRVWNVQNGWQLMRVIDDSKFIGVKSGLKPSSPTSDRVSSWLKVMASEHTFPPLPPPPLSGNAVFDALLQEIWEDFREFQNLGRALFGSYSQLRTKLSDEKFVKNLDRKAQGWNLDLLKWGSTDRWPRETVRALTQLSEALSQDVSEPAARELISLLKTTVDSISTPPEPVEVLLSTIENVINLPIWQRRHELYAVWIAAKITSQFPSELVEFHPVDGMLSFPFRATHLASIGPAGTARLELWSELRSRGAPGLVGRRADIQPDYRLKIPGAQGPASGSDILVVECKQYRRSDTSNFTAALQDYAVTCKDAIVTLVNYGPVGAAVIKSTPKAVALRCHAIGHTRPGGVGVNEFDRVLDAIALGTFRIKIKDHWLQSRITVELHWNVPGVDLDLHVATTNASCGFKTPLALPEMIFDRDDRGDGQPPAKETISITPRDSDRFNLVIVAYSGTEKLNAAGAHVVLKWEGPDGHPKSQQILLDDADGPIWHVASFLRGATAPIVENKAADGFAVGAGWTPDGRSSTSP
jgi:hypothetical protein